MSEHEMEMDEGDDIYEPEESKEQVKEPKAENDDDKKATSKSEELEEGEEEDEGGAMDEDEDDSVGICTTQSALMLTRPALQDIDIITERKDGTKAAPPSQAKYSDIRNIPQRSTSTDATAKATAVRKEDESKPSTALNIAAPSADQTSAAASKSTVDINAIPTYPAAGKPITQVNIDEGWCAPSHGMEWQCTVSGRQAKTHDADLPDNDKPWRKPGTDISDYFNYGFDEFTWALYAAKQESTRGEFGADVFASNNKKMMDEFNSMMMMGGMGMPGAGGANAAGGMDGMAPEMQAMMQQMMASGMDPSQMDPSQMNAMFSGMQNGAGGVGPQGNQGQNFGGAFGGNQGGYGYDPAMAAQGGGGRGGFGGGGRGRRGRW
ncbi:Pre-mRNA polyadenylation factor Fip1 [Drechmeria coniospora]|uniref:Pre-mRNA polyadenylation factor Fip1 n=1 Tax=Drechmeria coniospora TaxID=98403 RepID=A0A151GY00_DRECN|nr:Pre-mRNA polyadenylation factor Fip1 [Drechmeria coniospora]KYK61966.1 Pre-mRNA polyadenylation factor Fip1 [Drechmeria coniospora]